MSAVSAFAHNLKKVRGDIKPQVFADKLGIAPQTLASFEASISFPTCSMVLKICSALNVRNIHSFCFDKNFDINNQSNKSIKNVTLIDNDYKTAFNLKKAGNKLLV